MKQLVDWFKFGENEQILNCSLYHERLSWLETNSKTKFGTIWGHAVKACHQRRTLYQRNSQESSHRKTQAHRKCLVEMMDHRPPHLPNFRFKLLQPPSREETILLFVLGYIFFGKWQTGLLNISCLIFDIFPWDPTSPSNGLEIKMLLFLETGNTAFGERDITTSTS